MKPKILFVDDDEFIRKIYTDRLEASGFEIVTADSVNDANYKVEKFKFDLVCLDQALGTQSGIDVLHHIRQKLALQIPVLIFSASGQDKDIQKFKEASATEYIQKDHTTPVGLVEKINSYLKK